MQMHVAIGAGCEPTRQRCRLATVERRCMPAIGAIRRVRYAIPQAKSRPLGGRHRYQVAERGWPRQVRGGVEFGVERFGALDDGEFDGDAVLEMAHDLAAHGAERDLDAERRLDVDLDRRARQRQVDDAALILAAVGQLAARSSDCAARRARGGGLPAGRARACWRAR